MSSIWIKIRPSVYFVLLWIITHIGISLIPFFQHGLNITTSEYKSVDLFKYILHSLWALLMMRYSHWNTVQVIVLFILWSLAMINVYIWT